LTEISIFDGKFPRYTAKNCQLCALLSGLMRAKTATRTRMYGKSDARFCTNHSKVAPLMATVKSFSAFWSVSRGTNSETFVWLFWRQTTLLFSFISGIMIRSRLEIIPHSVDTEMAVKILSPVTMAVRMLALRNSVITLVDSGFIRFWRMRNPEKYFKTFTVDIHPLSGTLKKDFHWHDLQCYREILSDLWCCTKIFLKIFI